jgi:hypothetical protein
MAFVWLVLCGFMKFGVWFYDVELFYCEIYEMSIFLILTLSLSCLIKWINGLLINLKAIVSN